MKTIDLSSLINPNRQDRGYGVLCEFGTEYGPKKGEEFKFTVFDYLLEMPKAIETYEGFEGVEYTSLSHGYQPYCRPAFNIWQAHDGGECPLPEGFLFDAVHRGGAASKNHISELTNWVDSVHDAYRAVDIVQYKVTGIADGYQMP